MICPKCEEGIIAKVRLKANNTIGYMCEYCGTIWFEKEEINTRSGHPIRAYIKDEDIEYSLDEGYEKDPDDKGVKYSKFR